MFESCRYPKIIRDSGRRRMFVDGPIESDQIVPAGSIHGHRIFISGRLPSENSGLFRRDLFTRQPVMLEKNKSTNGYSTSRRCPIFTTRSPLDRATTPLSHRGCRSHNAWWGFQLSACDCPATLADIFDRYSQYSSDLRSSDPQNRSHRVIFHPSAKTRPDFRLGDTPILTVTTNELCQFASHGRRTRTVFRGLSKGC